MAISRKFACLLPTEASKKRLQGLSDRLGLDTTVGYDGEKISEFEYHMTLLYSVETELDYPDVIMPLGHVLSLNGAVVTTLGKAVVLRTTKTPKLMQIRENLVKNIGGSSSFEGFIPHVSLSYAPKDIDNFTDPIPFWYKSILWDRIQVKSSE